ncbi:MAG: hypothetical protein JO353_05745 [Phycisphaerae bacterium]|nr:hypothetical protein [Phycisphaerae bacterium]
MSDIINEWLSVEAAALKLGISSRSVARRVQNGQLESRVDANGRRSVLVSSPAPQPAAPELHPIPAELTAAVDQAAQQTGQTRAIVQQAMSVVIRSHEETMLAAREDAWAARRSMRRAWAAVAVIFVGAAATVGIVTYNMTSAADHVRQADQRLDQAQKSMHELTAERNTLRDELTQSKMQAANAEGQLSATLASDTRKATTMPTGLGRIASALFGD